MAYSFTVTMMVSVLKSMLNNIQAMLQRVLTATFLYAARSFRLSFKTVGYLAYVFFPHHSYYPTAWILDEFREHDWHYFSNAHLAK